MDKEDLNKWYMGLLDHLKRTYLKHKITIEEFFEKVAELVQYRKESLEKEEKKEAIRNQIDKFTLVAKPLKITPLEKKVAAALTLITDEICANMEEWVKTFNSAFLLSFEEINRLTILTAKMDKLLLDVGNFRMNQISKDSLLLQRCITTNENHQIKKFYNLPE